MRKLSSKTQQIIDDTEQISSIIADDEIADPSELNMEVDGDDGLPNYFNEDFKCTPN